MQRSVGHAYRLIGQYEEAIAVLKRSLIHNPDFWPTLVHLTVAYSEQGHKAEAQATAVKVLKTNPDFSLEMGRQSWPYKDPAQLERDIAALHEAGLE